MACVALAVGVPGCSPPDPNSRQTASPVPVSRHITGLPVKLTVKQRSTTGIPGSDGKLFITCDDITRGQVMVSVVDDEGIPVLGPVSLKKGAARAFHVSNDVYRLTLQELNNALVGEDFASFVVSDPSSGVLSESDKIEHLIALIETMEGAVFIRNGTEHPPGEAADHLRMKLKAADGRIETASQFIDFIATRSSISGKDYLIRLPTGETVRAGEYLHGELVRLHGNR